MAYNKLDIAVILSAEDRMSKVIQSATSNALGDLKALAGGLSAGYAFKEVMSAHLELEKSSASLQAVMLQDGGRMSQNFEGINNLAIQLGNRLPGTTADIQNMFAAMIRGGVQEEAILNGIGKAAAEFAIVTKLPFEEAATFAAKMKMATGTPDKDMGKLMDVIQRTVNLGVKADEMQYAFARSGGKLAAMGLQGVEASKGVSVLYAALMRAGQSGERVGTNMALVFDEMMDSKKMGKFNDELSKYGMHMNFFSKSGQFLGVENMVAQVEQLNKLNTIQRGDVVRAWLGPGADSNFIDSFARLGRDGYNALVHDMWKQANTSSKIDVITGTLGSKWEASMGNLTNAMAGLGHSFSDFFNFPEMTDQAAGFFGTLAKGLDKLNKDKYFKDTPVQKMLFDAEVAIANKIGDFAVNLVNSKPSNNPFYEKGNFSGTMKNYTMAFLYGKGYLNTLNYERGKGQYPDNNMTPSFIPAITLVMQTPEQGNSNGVSKEGISIHYAPVIQMSGTTSKEDLSSLLDGKAAALAKMLKEANEKNNRRKFQ